MGIQFHLHICCIAAILFHHRMDIDSIPGNGLGISVVDLGCPFISLELERIPMDFHIIGVPISGLSAASCLSSLFFTGMVLFQVFSIDHMGPVLLRIQPDQAGTDGISIAAFFNGDALPCLEAEAGAAPDLSAQGVELAAVHRIGACLADPSCRHMGQCPVR